VMVLATSIVWTV